MSEKENITEKAPELREQAEPPLQSGERRFRALVENLSDAIVLLGADGRFLYASPAASRINGYPMQVFMGQSAFEIIHPDDQTLVAQHFQQIQQTPGASATLLIRLLHRDGSWRWIDALATNQLADPAIGAIVVNYKDITERKQSEDALREREERHRAILKTAMDGFVQADVQGRLLEVNETYCRMSGYCEQELLTMRISDLEANETSAEIDARMQRVMGQGEKRFESRHRRKDGSIYEIEVSVQYRPDYGGRFFSFIRDITERKRAEKALRESEHEKSLILENASESIAYHDAEQNLVWANRAYQAATMPLTALRGRKCYNCWGLEKLCVNCPVSDAIRTGEPQSAELTPQNQPHWTADQGSWFIRATPVKNSDGIVIGAIEIAHDITESKQAEEELRVSRDQLRELASSLQTVREEERTRVARDIHDELAQELTRIKIDLVWLKSRLIKHGKASKVKALVARVEEMTQMADDAIQCVQKIATGLRPAVLDSLGLCAAVEWQARDFQVHAGISCIASLSEKELSVGGDIATAVFRILQESLTNVQRHATATRVEIVLRQEAGQLLLRIHDNGCGIPEEKLNSQKSIGLTDMNERALMLGGHFEVRTRPESGTTIEVRLPITKRDNI